MQVAQLCASHIDYLERLDNLKHNLQNIDGVESADIFISISSEKEYATHIVSLKSEFPKINIYTHSEKKSQFEHFQFLETQLDEAKDMWVMFFDDDDLCHPARFSVFKYFINLHSHNTDIIYFDQSALYDTEPPSNKKYCSQEYFSFTCKIRKFKDFFKLFDYITNINGCDLLFRNYLRILPNCKIIYQYAWQNYMNMKVDALYTHVLTENDHHSTISVDFDKLNKHWNNMLEVIKSYCPDYNNNLMTFVTVDLYE